MRECESVSSKTTTHSAAKPEILRGYSQSENQISNQKQYIYYNTIHKMIWSLVLAHFVLVVVNSTQQLPVETWQEIWTGLDDASLCKFSKSCRKYYYLKETKQMKEHRIMRKIDEIKRWGNVSFSPITQEFTSQTIMNQFLYGFDAALYGLWTVFLINENEYQHEIATIQTVLNLIKQYQQISPKLYSHYPPTKLSLKIQQETFESFDELRSIIDNIVDRYNDLHRQREIIPDSFVVVITYLKRRLHHIGYEIGYPVAVEAPPGIWNYKTTITSVPPFELFNRAKEKQSRMRSIDSKLKELHLEAQEIFDELESKEKVNDIQ